MEPTSQSLPVAPEAARAASAAAEDEHCADEHLVARGGLLRIALVAVAVGASWSFPWEPFLRINAVALAATLIGGYPIFKEAFEALRERRMTMELSMTIALVAALSIREAFTAVVIVLFVLVAEVGRGRRAIRDLLDLLPHTVVVRRADGVTEVASSALSVGEIVVIKPRRPCARGRAGGLRPLVRRPGGDQG